MVILPTVASFLNQDSIPLFIDGRSVASRGGFATVSNPSDGEALAKISMASSADVDAAVEAASKAFGKWSQMSASERAVLMHRLADRIEAELETLAQLEALDVGKAIANARAFDIPFGAEGLRYFADLSVHEHYSEPIALKNIEARIHKVPHGVCGFIFPWNFPFTLFCWGVGPALAAGNTVVVKPSEVTPLSSIYVARLASEVGFPDGVINVVPGSGPEAGHTLTTHPKINCFSFTGSPQVGRKIGAICAERLIPCKLELGGKGAAVVFDDADIDAAAIGLAGAITLNTGQVCCTATRWFIHEEIFEEFTGKVLRQLDKVRIGSSIDGATEMGPLVSRAQWDRVESYYKRGLAEGASSLSGNPFEGFSNGGGYFVKPHLLTGPDENICFREEVFGPTAYVVKFRKEPDAITRVNSLTYGLANSVWTSDRVRAQRVSEQMVAGNSWINAHNVFAYGLPYGGVNLSGLGGGVNSPETFAGYLRRQTIARPL